MLACARAGELERAAGIVIASGGNAGLANAYAAARAGVPAAVFVPETAPAFKVEKLRDRGVDSFSAERIRRGLHRRDRVCRRTGAVVCHAYDQPEIVAGAGTVGTELLDQLDGAVDTVIVAVGGGDSWPGSPPPWGHGRVVGVEPEPHPTLHTALARRAGRWISLSLALPPTPLARAGRRDRLTRWPSRLA